MIRLINFYFSSAAKINDFVGCLRVGGEIGWCADPIPRAAVASCVGKDRSQQGRTQKGCLSCG